jgi:hypothetical protein
MHKMEGSKMAITDLVDLADNIMSTSPTNLQPIVPANLDCSDAVERLSVSMQRARWDPARPGARANRIRGYFGHIGANPHHDDNTTSILGSYVTASEADPKNPLPEEYINANPKRLKDRVEELIKIGRDAAMRVRLLGRESNDEMQATPQRQHVIIHGNRGCGKTFLLNNILSLFSRMFDDEKVLWVRVNLAEEFGSEIGRDFDFKVYLRRYILAQLTKIVYRYYDPESELYGVGKPHPIPIIHHMDSIAEELGRGSRDPGNPREQVWNVRTAFSRKDNDPPISPGLIPIWVGDSVLGFVLRHGYCIIGILDGLDRLESSAYQRRRFRQLFDAAIGLVASGLGELGMAVVSVTRTNTLNTLPDISVKPNPYLAPDATVWKVHAVAFESVLGKRLKFIEQRIAQLGRSSGWTMGDWPAHLHGFAEFMKEPEETEVEGMSLQFFGDNRRAQMQAAQLRYFDYLLQERARPYLFLESLILGDRSVPSAPYQYEETGKGRLRRVFMGGTSFDNQLLPSIFSYPVVRAAAGAQSDSVPHREGSLWGIRNLQLVGAAERLHHRGSDLLSVNECCILLQRMFSYPLGYTEALLDQLREVEIVNLFNRDFPVTLKSGPQRVSIMPKGMYIIAKFIYEAAYLGLCAMRIPTTSSVDETMGGYFVGASLGGGSRVGSAEWDLTVSREYLDWVAAKVTNACGLVRLLCKLNAEQERLWREMSPNLDDRQRMIAREAIRGGGKVPGMFEFAGTLQQRVLAQVREIRRSVVVEDPRAEAYLTEKVGAWWSRWR